MNATVNEINALLAAKALRNSNWTWQELVDDPVLSRLPFQLELDKFGRIIMSPAANWFHGKTQGGLARWLANRLGGNAATEVAILHAEGTSEPDVIWAPKEFWSTLDRNRADLPIAPPLVCEVLSPSNTESEMQMKTSAYLGAGAKEVWLIGQDGSVRFFDTSGSIEFSRVADCDSSAVKTALFTD
jgi:Uma2 family endonuclease